MGAAKVKRIGVLTSGGDSPGMNTAIRAIVRTCAAYSIECLGIRRGYNGLINGDVVELDSRSVDGIITLGGTMLYTARCEEFKTESGIQKAANTCAYLGIDSLITIGGDGTFRGARALSEKGIKTIGIPGTIDNDIDCTDYTIGFDTACNTALDAVDKLRDTMQSHERCSVVEVMGARAGHLALYVGIASGATAVLTPETPVDFETDVFEKIRRGRISGRNHHIIIVAEGFGKVNEIADCIHHETGLETRVTILGHVQRGGSPTARDRVAATTMGCLAVDLIYQGKTNRVVCMRNGIICDLDITEALNMKKELSSEMLRAQKIVSR
ncbi:MAG: 6-phosphofructokinase [Clostridiales bacterium]|nr:6-phosphofructokinase [Clostridiales bacterium]